MEEKSEFVEQSQGSDFLAQPSVAKLARKLRRGSPIRLWLERRRANAVTGSGKDLLAALEHPAAEDWKDRVVGFQALRKVDLSPEERRQAGRLLSDVVDPDRERDAWRPRLGRAIAYLFLIGMILPLGFLGVNIFALAFASLSEHTLLYLKRAWEFVQSGHAVFRYTVEMFSPYTISFCLIGLIALPCCYAGLTIRDRMRSFAVQRSAMRSMQRIGGPDGIVALYKHLLRPTELAFEAIFALRVLLPTIDASWYGQLPDGVSQTLEGLAACSNESLVVEA